MTNIEQFITGAFFIPYVFFLVMCGVPLFFMEASYGQFSSLSPISIWRICPLFKGKYLLDRLYITYTVMNMYINIHVSHPCSHPFTRGRKTSNMCENTHCFWSFDASHVHHYNACTYNICSYYDKINVKFNLL